MCIKYPELENNKNDCKKFWKNIHEVLPIGVKSHKSINLINLDTNIDISENDTAEYINSFFAGIGPKLARNFDMPWLYEGGVSEHTLDNINTTNEEVLKICKEINVNKSSCIENISSRVLKDAFIHLHTKLTHLINVSMDTGLFPEKWKSANVIPLFKGGNRNEVGNHRPVSLLPLPSKIIEKIVHNRLSSHLETRNLLDECQGGFRKNHSTIDTTSKLTVDIYLGINNREVTLACFIDMAKAFDTVNHKILVNKLLKLGIGKNVLKWITNYLTNRNQCTTANGITSTYTDISCGVPQGSILGPLFFIIYVNDIVNILNHCKHLLYADDTVLYISGELTHTTALLQQDLNRFKIWCDRNQLTMNIKKTKYVTFGLKSQT